MNSLQCLNCASFFVFSSLMAACCACLMRFPGTSHQAQNTWLVGLCWNLYCFEDCMQHAKRGATMSPSCQQFHMPAVPHSPPPRAGTNLAGLRRSPPLPAKLRRCTVPAIGGVKTNDSKRPVARFILEMPKRRSSTSTRRHFPRVSLPESFLIFLFPSVIPSFLPSFLLSENSTSEAVWIKAFAKTKVSSNHRSFPNDTLALPQFPTLANNGITLKRFPLCVFHSHTKQKNLSKWSSNSRSPTVHYCCPPPPLDCLACPRWKGMGHGLMWMWNPKWNYSARRARQTCHCFHPARQMGWPQWTFKFSIGREYWNKTLKVDEEINSPGQFEPFPDQ